jgi:hypothetical protein
MGRGGVDQMLYGMTVSVRSRRSISDIECPLHPELAVQILIIQSLMPAHTTMSLFLTNQVALIWDVAAYPLLINSI